MIKQPAFAFANAENYLRSTETILENNDHTTRFFAPLPFGSDRVTRPSTGKVGSERGS